MNLIHKMDEIFKLYCEAICLLTEPPRKGCDLTKSFEINIENVCGKLSIDNLNILPTIKDYGIKVDDTSDVRWKWIALALHIFLSMKACQMEKDCMLSVRQEKAIRTCLEFIVSLGLLPGFLPGVGIPISKRCSSAAAEWVSQIDLSTQNIQLSIFELHERISAITKILVSCIEVEYLRGPIISRHLSDVLASLCQLSMVPLKKPQRDVEGGLMKDGSENACSSNEADQISGQCGSSRIFTKDRDVVKVPSLVREIEQETKPVDLIVKKNEEFIMTPELWARLQVERKYFSMALDKLVTETYQPLVIRDLLLLQGSPDKLAEKGKLAPLWLRRACANLLNSCLLRKGGIVSTVRAICDVFSVPQSKCDTWAQHVVLAKLVVMAVSAKRDDALCCRSICSQVTELLSVENVRDCKNYARAGVTCFSMLFDAEEEVCRSYILDPLMLPLVQAGEIKQANDAKVDEETNLSHSFNVEKITKDVKLLQCENSEKDFKDLEIEQKKVLGSVKTYDLDSIIEVIHFCFVENDPGMCLPAILLAPIFKILLIRYRDTISKIKERNILSSLLLKFLSCCADDFVLFKTLDSVLFEGSYDFKDLKHLAEQRSASENAEGMQTAEEIEEKLLRDLLEKHDKLDKSAVQELGTPSELGWGSTPLLELVSSSGAGEAAEVLFRYVLEALPKGGENSDEQKESGDWLLSIAKQSVATKLLCHLLEVPTVNEHVKKNPKGVVGFLGNFLAKEAEKAFGKRLQSNVDESSSSPDKHKDSSDDSLLSVSGDTSYPSFLDLGLNESENPIFEDTGSEVFKQQSHSEFVLVALLILKSLCEAENHKKDDNWWNPLRQILPQVRAFRRESSCPEVRAMAEDVACSILTKGKVSNGESLKNKPGGKSNRKGESQESSHKEGENAASKENLTDFRDALKMAQENAVHLKGHALISLTKLIASRDPVTMRNQTTLLQLFQDNLKHDDSYIYLAAINGLEKLGDVFPDQVLESLADEFAEIGVVKAGNTAFNNVRLKVGEALLRVTRTLGEMIPKYSCLLLNAFLGGVRDGDGLVRASSLSNLGEVCKLLSFRLGSITTEVLWCVRCVLETDCAVEARRAAILVITLLLQGMGVSVFKVLEDILPELYRTLKFVRSNDQDEVVQVHAQLALEELDRITMQFLFPPQNLQKKIFVLDPPS